MSSGLHLSFSLPRAAAASRIFDRTVGEARRLSFPLAWIVHAGESRVVPSQLRTCWTIAAQARTGHKRLFPVLNIATVSHPPSLNTLNDALLNAAFADHSSTQCQKCTRPHGPSAPPPAQPTAASKLDQSGQTTNCNESHTSAPAAQWTPTPLGRMSCPTDPSHPEP